MIYLVCWSDSAVQHPSYYVEAAFTTKTAAQEFIDKLNLYPPGSDCKGIYGEPWIKEMELC